MKKFKFNGDADKEINQEKRDKVTRNFISELFASSMKFKIIFYGTIILIFLLYLNIKVFGFEESYTKIYLNEPLEKRAKFGFLEDRENCKFLFKKDGVNENIILDFSKDIESYTDGKTYDGEIFLYARTVNGNKYAIQVITSQNYKYFDMPKVEYYLTECSLKYGGGE